MQIVLYPVLIDNEIQVHQHIDTCAGKYFWYSYTSVCVRKCMARYEHVHKLTEGLLWTGTCVAATFGTGCTHQPTTGVQDSSIRLHESSSRLLDLDFSRHITVYSIKLFKVFVIPVNKEVTGYKTFECYNCMKINIVDIKQYIDCVHTCISVYLYV